MKYKTEQQFLSAIEKNNFELKIVRERILTIKKQLELSQTDLGGLKIEADLLQEEYKKFILNSR